MGKTRRLSSHYGIDSSLLYRARIYLIRVLQQIRHLAVPAYSRVAARSFQLTVSPQAKAVHRTLPTTIDNLEDQVLQACAAKPTAFHDLLTLLALKEEYKTLTFDLGEQIARKGLAETRFRACRMCVKITPQGIAYLKEQESRATINPLLTAAQL